MDRRLKALFCFCLPALLLADLWHSGRHAYDMPLDGDVARITAPMSYYSQVLEDPFGWKALSQGISYSGAGRYFCHVSEKAWFDAVPILLHRLGVGPVPALFATQAVFWVLLQCLFLLLATAYATAGLQRIPLQILVLAALSSVLVQAGSYAQVMAVIDRSVTYAFFYGLPVLALAAWAYPAYRNSLNSNENPPGAALVLLLALGTIPLAFSGPLVQPVLLLTGLLVFARPVWDPGSSGKMHRAYRLLLLLFMGICLYAFWVSTHNNENVLSLPLLEKYRRLGKGLFSLLSTKPAWLFLFLAIAINLLYLKRNDPAAWRQSLAILRFLACFSLAYLLLLPWGGYREYRPNILRADTFLPLTLLILFLFLRTTAFCLQSALARPLSGYLVLPAGILLVFFLADRPRPGDAAECQKRLFHELAAQKGPDPARIPYDCEVLTWHATDTAEAEVMQAMNRCLQRWQILEAGQRFEFKSNGP